MAEDTNTQTQEDHDVLMSDSYDEDVIRRRISDITVEEKTYLISVAIDFGTTYSGYAFSTKAEYKRDPLQIFSNTWAATSGQALMSLKTPTCLLLYPDKEVKAFGFEAEEEYAELAQDNEHREHFYFNKFKMRLFGQETIAEVIEDITGKPMSTIDVFAKSIDYLKGHFHKKLDSLGHIIKDDEIGWVLTVPAIWDDFAKKLMRKAAVQAGIPDENLTLALEPESASLYCQHLYTQRTEEGFGVTKEGTKFMVLDLGGGTADITVQEKLADGKLKEIHRATGGPFGGTFLNNAFEHLLGRLLGNEVFDKLKIQHLYEYMELLREFEVSKRSIVSKSNTLRTFNVKIPAVLMELCQEVKDKTFRELVESDATFSTRMALKGDKLRINQTVITEMFHQVLAPICKQVSEILGAPDGDQISLIQMVGGFSESQLVQETIKEKFQTESRRILVPPDAGLAVLKGAVIFGHSPKSIESRVIRYTYGNAIRATFEEGVHDEDKKYDDGTRVWCRSIFKPFMKAGTSVKVGHTFHHSMSTTHYDTARMKIYVSDREDTRYVTDEGCRELCNILFNEVLPADVTKKQTVKQIITFGETELYIKIINKGTKAAHRLSVKMR